MMKRVLYMSAVAAAMMFVACSGGTKEETKETKKAEMVEEKKADSTMVEVKDSAAVEMKDSTAMEVDSTKMK